MKAIIRRFKAWQFDRQIAKTRQFLQGYNRAMIALNVPRTERKRRLRELVDGL